MIYDPNKLLLLAGPCSLESLDTCRPVADALAALQQKHPELNILFKGSFDKANRTSIQSDRGTGLEGGLEIFQTIKAEYGFKTVTDIHLPDQCATVGAVVDAMQIPAFLCRQTDLLVAAAQTDCAINVKKGQFLSPYEMTFVTNKLEEAGAKEIWQTDRGTTFGYQNLVVDMRSFSIMAANGHPTIIDATHSVQLPGAAGGISGGQREFVPPLARAALAAGANGVFLETHPNPEKAISDAASQVPLNELPELIESLLRVWQAVR
ncbi:MAG: 3-deoxy-8-phosphooctulonate synthase [Opitutales bacterium]|jgi:2-dehydro-3-deoxyphosphooctonate aldolase (KDO 8-P synthase)|nr:3-deoxy-8-phosphooctulonate synthase [Opitutales bacterium]MDP4645325.1 3-deoxy-8-phosphooctulonate synthase [Opitutales bacterium]MDP4776456.1 3-deoxy-8-phosphooctulonate synthase [Opitutales bacterium]MDP4883004.1 3-deoxy-8-phosphooctulonate synthase [Opitutales bacterium]MDP5079217.1 3-deoxy-8-phosphooctulonate synthase [Opitutales bacterium]